eukprot:Gb_27590 [translate_table: standard]
MHKERLVFESPKGPRRLLVASGWTPPIRGSGAKTEETRQSLAESAPAIVSHRRGGHVKLTGSNTFAMPRNVTRPLGWGTKDGRSTETEETPKSNEEFRKMLLKS